MCTITATEFKTNFGKYAKLAQKERIEVTSHGNVIFVIVPKNEDRYNRAMSLVGSLPANVPFEIDRECIYK